MVEPVPSEDAEGSGVAGLQDLGQLARGGRAGGEGGLEAGLARKAFLQHINEMG